jgi:hypothetical protein
MRKLESLAAEAALPGAEFGSIPAQSWQKHGNRAARPCPHVVDKLWYRCRDQIADWMATRLRIAGIDR